MKHLRTQPTPASPLPPHEMVPDSILRDLGSEDPGRQHGDLSAIHQTILAMYLPEICGELLAHRLAARAST